MFKKKKNRAFHLQQGKIHYTKGSDITKCMSLSFTHTFSQKKEEILYIHVCQRPQTNMNLIPVEMNGDCIANEELTWIHMK